MDQIAIRVLGAALALVLCGCPPGDEGTDYPCQIDEHCEAGDFCQGEIEGGADGVCVEGTDADGDDSKAGVDCDDSDASSYPGAPELCDGVDNDCDPETEAAGGESDADGDDFLGCSDCEEGVLCGDCDDEDPAANGSDADGDGFSTCQKDCDDADEDRFPGNDEVCDGQDNDCDGSPAANEADKDSDGYMICEDDCDDGDGAISPVGAEVCGNSIDENCDGDEERCWLDVAVVSGVTCGVTEPGAALCWGWADWVEDLEEEPAGPFGAIALSRHRRACATHVDGAVSCWDANGTTIPGAAGPYESVCTGDTFTCGLDSDGLPACWPEQTGWEYPMPSEELQQLDCSATQVCGVGVDGQLHCWGDDGYGSVSEAPIGTGFAAAAASRDASCAVRSDGEVECWSDLDVWEDVTTPSGPFCSIDISTSGGGGLGPVCAVRGDPGEPCAGGAAVCWADSLGASPPAGEEFVKVVVAWGSSFTGDPGPHACGLTPSGLIRCWGGIEGPQLHPPAL